MQITPVKCKLLFHSFTTWIKQDNTLTFSLSLPSWSLVSEQYHIITKKNHAAINMTYLYNSMKSALLYSLFYNTKQVLDPDKFSFLKSRPVNLGLPLPLVQTLMYSGFLPTVKTLFIL